MVIYYGYIIYFMYFFNTSSQAADNMSVGITHPPNLII